MKDCYFIKAIGKNAEFLKMFLVKNDSSWRWEGVIHEVLRSSDSAKSRELFDKATISYDETSGYRAQNPQKYLDDIDILQKALIKEPDHPRYTFYLAQSYLHADFSDLALMTYEKRVKLDADPEEVFWSYYCIGCLREELGYPLVSIMEAFCKAYQHKPDQAESLYLLASHLKEYPFLAYLIANYAKNISLPQTAARMQEWMYHKIPELCAESEKEFLSESSQHSSSNQVEM